MPQSLHRVKLRKTWISYLPNPDPRHSVYNLEYSGRIPVTPVCYLRRTCKLYDRYGTGTIHNPEKEFTCQILRADNRQEDTV
jgi:hypothetical protein